MITLLTYYTSTFVDAILRHIQYLIIVELISHLLNITYETGAMTKALDLMTS